MPSDRQQIVRDILSMAPLSGEFSIPNLGAKALSWAGRPFGLAENEYLSKFHKSIYSDIIEEQARHVLAGGIKAIEVVDRDIPRVRFIRSNEGYQNYRRVYLRAVTSRWLEALDDRQYEFACALGMRRLGATRLLVTSKGDEFGADFYAEIPVFSRHSTMFSKQKGVRILGQSKKYSNRVSRKEVMSFNDCVAATRYVGNDLNRVSPGWFRASKLPLLGCFVASFGYQSGAEKWGYQSGHLMIDGLALAEIIGCPRVFDPSASIVEIERRLWMELRETEFFAAP